MNFKMLMILGEMKSDKSAKVQSMVVSLIFTKYELKQMWFYLMLIILINLYGNKDKI